MRLLRHRVTVRFRDCDPLGHVNNAVYLTYLEQARFTLWRTQVDFLSRKADQPGARGIGFILARAECDFKAQARFGDQLEVQLSLERVGRTSFTYAYQVTNAQTGVLVATARTVQVLFDYDKEKPVELSEELKQRLSTGVTQDTES